MSAGQDAPAPRVSDGEDELLAAMERANDWLSPTERRELEQSHLNAINALFRLADKWVAEHRAEIGRLNARLATARRDALLEAAEIADKRWFDGRPSPAGKAIRAAAATVKTEGA